MPIKSYKPTSPGRRGMTVSTFEEITQTTPERSLLEPLKKRAGRNFRGKITVRRRGGGHKRRYRVIDFKRDKFGVPARVVSIEYDPNSESMIQIVEEQKSEDIFGHGTACASIIHSLAPEAELYSVRVISQNLGAKAVQFAGGIRWAIDHGMHIVNMSLSTSRHEYYGLFHELVDEAYFKHMLLVSAVNNIPVASYPSLYSSVISVAAHDGKDPFTYYYNPTPPVEFGAPGIDMKVAWLEKSYCVITGNSFAAPHITGLVALIKGKHPDLIPFQIKTVLFACASNIRSQIKESGI